MNEINKKVGFPVDPLKFFSEKEITKHNNYDFTNSDFKGTSKPLSFRCSIHDKELHIEIASYLRKKFNHCKECKEEASTKLKSKNLEKRIALKKSDNKEKRTYNFYNHSNVVIHKSYDFSESDFKGVNKPFTLRCSIHNKEIVLKKAELLKTNKNNKCEECEAEFIEFYQTEKFIVKANRLFNSKFNYSKVEDYRYKEHVTIICPIHGEFTQVPNVHLRSVSGCTKCGEDLAASLGGYSRSAYINKTKSDTSNVYVIKLTGNNESFYKIGITSYTVDERFKQGYLPEEYSIEIKYIFSELDKGIAYDFEKLLHKNNKLNKYNPLIKFAGYTECFRQVPTDLKQYQDLLETITAI